MHIYTTQGNYSVKLVVKNGSCADSQIVALSLPHPLGAAFNTSDDSLCQNEAVSFTNNSVATTLNCIAPRYL